MMKRTFAVAVVGFAAVLALVSAAEAGWIETWNSYAADTALPAGDWTIASANAPFVMDDNALLPLPPRSLDGPRDDDGTSVDSLIFRPVDPGDTTLRFSWFRRKGNLLPTRQRVLEIGMYTSTDANSERVTLNYSAHVDDPEEHFDSSPGGDSWPTGIFDDSEPYDGIIQLLPGGTHARVGWRLNEVGGPYTESTVPLPAGFGFNYVGIRKLGGAPGPNAPNAWVDNIEVVPEPASVALIGMSLLGLLAFGPWRRG